jgi:hypothetical protein
MDGFEQGNGKLFPFKPSPALALVGLKIPRCSRHPAGNNEDGKEMSLCFLKYVVAVGAELNGFGTKASLFFKLTQRAGFQRFPELQAASRGSPGSAAMGTFTPSE